MKKKSNSQHVHMKKHCLKNRLRSGVALIVLVGWSSIASAQWTPLANAFPSGFAYTCLLLTDGTVMCHEYNTNRWHRLNPDINGSYQNGSWDVPGFTVADMPNGNDPSFGCVNCPYHAAVLRVGGAAGWTSGCHRRRIQRRSPRVDQHRVHVRSGCQLVVESVDCAVSRRPGR